MKQLLTISIICLVLSFNQVNFLYSQVTISDYNRADSTAKFDDLVYHGYIIPKWIDSTNNFWYKVKTRKGDEYFLIDAPKQKKKAAFDQEKLCARINSKTGKKHKPYSIPLMNISFSENLKELEFELDSFKWKCNLADYKLTRLDKVKPEKRKYWAESRDELSNPPVVSPDSSWTACIKNYNVYVKDIKTNKEHQLSYDGSEGEFYSSFILWSPDSRMLTTNKIRDNKKHYIYFVESSPENQLQPVLHKREYLKPGDALPVKKPSLFNISEKKQIPVNTTDFENQYYISNTKWWKDSRGFTFEFNQRGHQVYQVVEVNGSSGDVKVIVDERNKTFIDYSGKRYRHDVNDGKEIIWASERDGWNHLYLIDGETGIAKNQITKGEWVVRGVINVDEKTRQIIFMGSGQNKGEDPYFIHYYKINFDGSGMVDLTPEHANHRATFSRNYNYFVDNYSAVNLPHVTLLRDASDGKILMQIEQADIRDLLAKGWKTPEVFVAKGRDGHTEIWGNIYRPTNFDSTKSYPVLEHIYAGPHSSFVQKYFRPAMRFTPIAELGFIVVKIDGMGTSNRSKAFHDVCWKNLKDAGFPDRKLWIKAAAEKYPYMDTSRIGIFGTSAGGQSALAALLFHPEFYKAAVSSCGCHDNRMDKIWWNEQWMGYPVGPHYSECSNVVNAGKLTGHLMLIVGEIDDNVDPASTLQVADALIKADKDFELVVLPGKNHTSGGKYGERKRRDFFVRHLLGVDPPDWNLSETNNNKNNNLNLKP
ncbi:MAG: DPP IV N-terminal domain-containing protein [Bacteroidales bacterium]|nr:MAG: DPP IV N-terminal domain-containing protein [Bacteroidales bacterium]